MPKLVDNNHYHLWTDALHARALAHRAKNRWDWGYIESPITLILMIKSEKYLCGK